VTRSLASAQPTEGEPASASKRKTRRMQPQPHSQKSSPSTEANEMKSKSQLRPFILVSLIAAVQGLTGCTVAAEDESWEDVGETEQEVIVYNDVVKLVGAQSGKCLDVAGAANWDGANIQIWNCNWTKAQLFRRQTMQGAAFRLVNVASGKCVDVSGAAKYDGANIQQWTCNGTAAQLFYIREVDGTYSGVINLGSGKALDVEGWRDYAGANVQQWTYGGGNNQKWALVAENALPPPALGLAATVGGPATRPQAW
jgi:hypothetical protein